MNGRLVAPTGVVDSSANQQAATEAAQKNQGDKQK
jgi:hypothetical protein